MEWVCDALVENGRLEICQGGEGMVAHPEV